MWSLSSTPSPALASIPATAFASTGNAHLYENFLRFSFCKDGEIEEAAERLQKVRAKGSWRCWANTCPPQQLKPYLAR